MRNVQVMEYRGAHRLWLRFNNGAEGEVDLPAHLVGPVFLPLRDPALFAAVRLDPGPPNAWESTDVVDLRYQRVRPGGRWPGEPSSSSSRETRHLYLSPAEPDARTLHDLPTARHAAFALPCGESWCHAGELS